MGDILAFGIFASLVAPFLVTCIFTLIGFFVGRAYGRRQGYDAGWNDCVEKGGIDFGFSADFDV